MYGVISANDASLINRNQYHPINPLTQCSDWKSSSGKMSDSSEEKSDRNAFQEKFQEIPIPEKIFVTSNIPVKISPVNHSGDRILIVENM